MNWILRWCCIALAMCCITACSGINLRSQPVMAVPIQNSFEQQSVLSQLSYYLSRKQRNQDEHVQLLFERGVLYHQMGMTLFAQQDFLNALRIRPDIPEIYNFLGIYLTQQGDLDSAFQAFDSVLELDPTYEFAIFNRGAALYVAGRYELARDDLQAFYHNDPSDPIRLLWLHLAEKEIDAKQAIKNLHDRYNIDHRDEAKWGWELIEFYLGDINESTLMKRLQKKSTDNTSLAENLSEAYFYLGKYYLSLGDKKRAETCFKLAVAQNVYSFIEHRYALLELTKLSRNKDNVSESN